MASSLKQHILVVDDDSAVRSSMGMILKMSGYDVRRRIFKESKRRFACFAQAM